MKFWVHTSNSVPPMSYLCNLKHKRQTLSDFQNDCHRFSLWFDGNETEVQCYGHIDVFFDETIPDSVQYEIQKKVYQLIDESEARWTVPKGAQEIADAYCAEEFY